MSEDQIDILAKELAAQLECDDVEFGYAWMTAKKLLPEVAEEALRDLLSKAVAKLVNDGRAKIADYLRGRDPEWMIWIGSAEEQRTEIIRRWDALGRAPEYISGEIGWILHPQASPQSMPAWLVAYEEELKKRLGTTE